MSLFEKKYNIKDWKGNKHRLTAKQLCGRVLADSKSNYEWIASATELVRVCNEPDFPEMYAQVIKINILNCFANVALKGEYPSGEKTDEAAVYSCYNSLASTDETVVRVKQKYLTAIIIETITKYTKYEEPGQNYKKICKEWKKAKFDEYVSKEKIDFDELRKKLHSDFKNTIKSAEEAGAFEEDEEKDIEEFIKFLEGINNIIR